MNKISFAAAALVFSIATPVVEAATVPPAAVQYTSVFEDVGFVKGYDAFSEKITLTSGDYRLTLTDFDFGDEFAKLGVMLSTATGNLYTIKKPVGAPDGEGEDFWQQSINFSLTAGQYYLSFFGKSEGELSFYGIELDKQVGTSPAPVPVPAAFLLFGSGLLALAGFARRREA